MDKHSKPRQVFKSHPIYGWTLTPNSEIQVPFRNNVIQVIDHNGLRRVPFVAEKTKKKLAIYGCSFTYGTGLRDEETYVALLQSSLSEVQIQNKGVGGYSSVQNYLRFSADIKAMEVDMAIFGVISDHRYRNVAHPYRMKAYQSLDWHRIGVEQIPHIHLDRQGEAFIDYTPIWQPSLIRNDFDIFLADEFYLDLTTIAVFREILKLATENKICVVFALLDQLDPQFNQRLLSEFAEVIDISTPYNQKYSFQPDDIHPNPLANQLYAQRLLPVVQSMMLEC